MIRYNAGDFGMLFVFQISGSVFPRALRIALPNAILAVCCHMFLRGTVNVEDTSGWGVLGMGGAEVIWGGYNFVLGFLIVFRNNQAYMRFWDGAMMIAEIRGNWFHAISNLIAFCSTKEELYEEVQQFQHMLIKLVSILFCASLQRISDLEDDSLEIVDVQGIDTTSLGYLSTSKYRCEISMQWLQQHIVDAKRQGLIDIEAPILSRVFQELTNGMVQLNRVQNIKDIPFPFPYAQMISTMLLVHWVVTPLMAAAFMQSAFWCGVLCFCTIGSFWSLIYIAREIDQPFGDDANDLPVQGIMEEFNEMLFVLLHPMTQSRPQYVHNFSRKPGKQRTWSQHSGGEDIGLWELTRGFEEIVEIDVTHGMYMPEPRRQCSPMSENLPHLKEEDMSLDAAEPTSPKSVESVTSEIRASALPEENSLPLLPESAKTNIAELFAADEDGQPHSFGASKISVSSTRCSPSEEIDHSQSKASSEQVPQKDLNESEHFGDSDSGERAVRTSIDGNRNRQSIVGKDLSQHGVTQSESSASGAEGHNVTQPESSVLGPRGSRVWSSWWQPSS